jgi:hypothetical protein
MSGSQVGQDHLSDCKTDAFTRGAPLMSASSPRLFFLRPMSPNGEESPPSWISSQALEPSDLAYGAAALVKPDRKRAQEAAHDLLSYTVRYPTALRGGVYERPQLAWLFWIGTRVLGALLAMQLVPYGRDHTNPPLRSEPPWDSPATRDLARQASSTATATRRSGPPTRASRQCRGSSSTTWTKAAPC